MRLCILIVSSFSQKTFFVPTDANSAYSLLNSTVLFGLLLAFVSCPLICLCVAQVRRDWILRGLKCMLSYRTDFPLRPSTCPHLRGRRCFPTCTLWSLASEAKWLSHCKDDFLHHLSPSSAVRTSYWLCPSHSHLCALYSVSPLNHSSSFTTSIIDITGASSPTKNQLYLLLVCISWHTECSSSHSQAIPAPGLFHESSNLEVTL